MLGERAIENRIKKIKDLEAQKKKIEAEISALKDEIKEDMTEKGVDECQTKNFVVRWKKIVSSSFDSKKFKSENPDIYSLYLVQGSCKRFTIN